MPPPKQPTNSAAAAEAADGGPQACEGFDDTVRRAKIAGLMSAMEQEHGVDPLYNERFACDAAADCVVTASVPLETVEFVARKADARRLQAS